MMVLFVSQCEKKALARTRRVLDAFADRIGDNTWQTVITQEGLLAVKKLLRKTASKNTAVSCHWIRSRARSDLLWIVGNKNKFNHQGVVPVNNTDADANQYQDKVSWQTLPIIQYAAAIAGLFHDFGKVTILFQTKIDPNRPKGTLNYEPYRHEWVSLRLFEAFVRGKTDQQWLDDLAEQTMLTKYFQRDGLDKSIKNPSPLRGMSPFAQLVGWLIVSHHKLPYSDDGMPFKVDGEWHVENWMSEEFNAQWNSKNANNVELKKAIEENWTIHNLGLPFNSSDWQAKANNLARKAKEVIANNSNNFLNEELYTSHISRLCLMLADHYFSSLDSQTDISKSRHYKVYANTKLNQNGEKEYKQQLDEHLIGVAHHAGKIAKQLPKLRQSLPSLQGNHFLEKPCEKKYKEKFGWQDKAVNLTKKIAVKTDQHGFFGINMASTGCGKTLANAKIMYALGDETRGVRFSVAMGLRTLTLQTGKELQEAAKLSQEELAIAVGGIAVKALFEEQNKQVQETEFGSESAAENTNSGAIREFVQSTEHSLSTWTKPRAGNKDRKKIDKLITAPVLSCTIDHLIPATEGIRGGQQIAPMLRLLTSDLIIDEPDDFGLDDLPALTRLVHWAGMLGSRVLLSTATMPPALVYACYQAYQQGWSHYAKANLPNTERAIQCAWFDECLGDKQNPIGEIIEDFSEFKQRHKNFVNSRIASLKLFPEQFEKRKAKIVYSDKTITSPVEKLAEQIARSVTELHDHHHLTHTSGKTLSIGLVRMANIDPLVAVTKQLLIRQPPENTQIHYCVYHSHHPLAVRSHIEAKLDRILKRKNNDAIWEDEDIKPKLSGESAKHHIFIVVASPVAEVGRDHDYDWAIIEPSSIRSIIQIAGRVLRHRDTVPSNENIHLLNQNIKGLKEVRPCFKNPGFETDKFKAKDSELREVLNEGEYQKVNATPRIEMPEESDNKKDNELMLNDIEHNALINKLVLDEKPASVWWQQTPHWCAEVQRQQRFRKPTKDSTYVLFVENEHKTDWKQKNTEVLPPVLGELIGTEINQDNIVCNKGNQFWFDLDAVTIYQGLAQQLNKDLPEISDLFGEVTIASYSNDQEMFNFNQQLGLYREYK